MYRYDPMPVNLAHPTLDQNVDVVTTTEKGFRHGALLYMDASAGYVKSANALTWTTDKLTTQKLFARQFVGIATATINVDRLASVVDSVYSAGGWAFEAGSDTYAVGDLLGVAKQSAGNVLEEMKVEKVTDPDAAIAIVIEPTAASATKVWARVIPAIYNQLAPLQIHDIAFTISGEAAGGAAADTNRVTLQLKDRFGRDLKGVRTVRVMLLDSAADTAITADAPGGAVAAVATFGSIVAITAKIHLMVTTNADGIAKIDITNAGETDSWVMRAYFNDRSANSGTISFAA